LLAHSPSGTPIIYTLTDEAPLLATCAFLPIIRTFTAPAGVDVEKADISVSARVLAEFPEYLPKTSASPTRSPSWAA
jgi:isocitrate dehydrogenase